MPDLLKAVKILAGSTVEIAAASVGERSLVKAVREMEEDGKGLDSSLEVVVPEIQAATSEGVADEAAVEATVVVNEEELKSAEADAEDAEAPAAEEETPAPVAVAKGEEAASAPTVEEVGEAEAEDQDPVTGAAPEETVSSAEAFPEDAAPAEQAAITAAETPVDEAAAEASPEESFEAAAAVDMVQLAAASSGSDLEVLSAAEPESTSEAPVHEACHSSPSAAEEVAPPVALGGQLASEGADITLETKEVSQSKNIVRSVGTTNSLSIARFVTFIKCKVRN